MNNLNALLDKNYTNLKLPENLPSGYVRLKKGLKYQTYAAFYVIMEYFASESFKDPTKLHYWSDINLKLFQSCKIVELSVPKNDSKFLDKFVSFKNTPIFTHISIDKTFLKKSGKLKANTLEVRGVDVTDLEAVAFKYAGFIKCTGKLTHITLPEDTFVYLENSKITFQEGTFIKECAVYTIFDNIDLTGCFFDFLEIHLLGGLSLNILEYPDFDIGCKVVDLLKIVVPYSSYSIDYIDTVLKRFADSLSEKVYCGKGTVHVQVYSRVVSSNTYLYGTLYSV